MVLQIRDLLGTIYTDELFADLFLTHGQPAETPTTPEGTGRLYLDSHFLTTGAAVSETQFRAARATGRAFLKNVPYDPPYAPDAQYPLRLTTGRTVYHFHTRTKTRRTPNCKPPQRCGWNCPNRTPLGGATSTRPRTRGRCARAWCSPLALRRHCQHRGQRSDLTAWDPVSKQPEFKVAAVSATG